MIMHRVILPWPDRSLSPNARPHWAEKARAVKAAKTQAHYLAIAAGIGKLDLPRMTVRLTFCPPSRRRFDLDNVLASMKAQMDAIAALTGIDDSLWSFQIERGDTSKDGGVIVELFDAAP